MAPKVVGHWMPSLPIALDDIDPNSTPGDYYKRNYLTTSGEGGIHAVYGGFLRDAPAIRTDIARPIGGDYSLSDMRVEVARARAAGLDMIGPDLLNLSGSANHTRVQKLMQAADEDGVLKVFLIPDLTSASVWNLTQDQFAAAIADLAAHSSVAKLADGRLIIAPFCGTYTTVGTQPSKSPTWWSQTNAKITALTGLTVCFLPIYNSLPTTVFDAFDSVCDGYGSWGSRNPAATANLATLAATMRARTGNSSKIWVAPVSFMDSRPNQKIFDENNGSQQLRDSWTQAIASCTGPNDFVQLITLNDYVECSYFSLSRRNGATAIKASQYYAYKLRNGAFPTPSVDSVSLIHRKQIAAPVVVTTAARTAGTAYTSLTVSALGADRPVAGDKLHFTDGQVVTVAASPASGATSITINSWTPTTTLASGVPATKKTWTFVPPSGNYQPMANRRHRGSVASTDTVNIVEVLTYLTAPAQVTATVGGVAQATYTAPAGENVQTYPSAAGAAPSVTITRSSVTVLSLTSPEAITATPVVQDMSYVTAYAENPPIAVPTAPDPTAIRIRQASDTAANLTTANPTLKLGEVVWERASTAAAFTKFKVGDGVTAWNTLPYFSTGSGGSVTPDVQAFTASGTWTKPAGAYTWAEITVQAAGAGGGSGRRGATATVRCGGGGGGGGGRTVRRIRFSDLGATETVTVVAAGSGGAAAGTDDTNGNNGGTTAGPTFFGDWARVGAVTGGNGGTNAAGAGGSGGSGQFGGSAGGTANTAGGAGVAGGTAGDAGAGGGSGAGLTTANAAANGGAGGGISSVVLATPAGGIAGGAAAGTVDQPVGTAQPGAGGGGGGTGGQAGATGGRYGGGGGGGGASLNGTASGAGGAGGPGYVRVVCY